MVPDRNRDVSIGPRLFSHGYEMGLLLGTTTTQSVSIGPRLFSHGYRGIRVTTRPGRWCFNWATTFQPWIQNLRGKGEKGNIGFNWATTFQPWIRHFVKIYHHHV